MRDLSGVPELSGSTQSRDTFSHTLPSLGLSRMQTSICTLKVVREIWGREGAMDHAFLLMG